MISLRFFWHFSVWIRGKPARFHFLIAYGVFPLSFLLPSDVVFFGEGERGLLRDLEPDAVFVEFVLLHVLDVLLYRGRDV